MLFFMAFSSFNTLILLGKRRGSLLKFSGTPVISRAQPTGKVIHDSKANFATGLRVFFGDRL